MMTKTIHIMVSVLVALTIWCAAVMFAIVTLRVLVIGAITAYHLLHP